MFSFYNVRKPRQFDHKPIYWDPHKESLNKRVQAVKQEIGLEIPEGEYIPHIKGTFVEGTSHLKKSRDKGYDSRGRTYKNVKLVLAVALLGGLLWFLLM